MKKEDEAEAARHYISREEQELKDVEREMEEQLVEQHSKVSMGAVGCCEQGCAYTMLIKMDCGCFMRVWAFMETLLVSKHNGASSNALQLKDG